MTGRIRKKRRKKRTRNPVTHHHLCWTRANWSGEYAQKFRRFHYNIVTFPLNGLHEAIHNEMDGIPVPSEDNAKEMLEHLNILERYGGISDKDSAVKRLKVLVALFTYIEQPTADALQKELEIIESYSKKPR